MSYVGGANIHNNYFCDGLIILTNWDHRMALHAKDFATELQSIFPRRQSPIWFDYTDKWRHVWSIKDDNEDDEDSDESTADVANSVRVWTLYRRELHLTYRV